MLALHFARSLFGTLLLHNLRLIRFFLVYLRIMCWFQFPDTVPFFMNAHQFG